jgi:hypothetical protein
MKPGPPVLWQTYFALAVSAQTRQLQRCLLLAVGARNSSWTHSEVTSARARLTAALRRRMGGHPADLFRTTTKVTPTHVSRSRGQRCGDIELADFLADAAGPINLVMDLRITHER